MENKKRVYDVINVRAETKLKVNEIYYRLKIKKKYRKYDDFILELLKVFEANENKA